MARELILMSDVDGLGLEGNRVKVADGYARNYLIPRKLGVPVTTAALRRLEKNRVERESRQKADQESAEAQKAAIEKLSLTIAVKVGENEKLFGSVTSADVADALKAQSITVDRHRIHLEQPIRELGVYSIKIRLHPKIDATMKLWIVGE